MPNQADWGVDAFTLTIPTGAGPNDNRITIGEALPADLVAFYVAAGYTPIGGFVLYHPPNEYVYLILCITNGALPALCCGTRNTFGISEQWEIFPTNGLAGSQMETGHINTTATTLYDAGTNLTVFGTLGMSTNSLLIVTAGAELRINTTGKFTIDGESQGRGWVGGASSAVATGAIGPAETIILTTGNITFVDGRAYQVILAENPTPAVAHVEQYLIRNNGGAVLNSFQHTFATAGQQVRITDVDYIKRTAGSNLVTPLTASVLTSAGATNVGYRFLDVYDIGSATRYPDATAI